MTPEECATKIQILRDQALEGGVGFSARASLAYRQALTFLELAEIAFELAGMEQARSIASRQTGGKLP